MHFFRKGEVAKLHLVGGGGPECALSSPYDILLGGGGGGEGGGADVAKLHLMGALFDGGPGACDQPALP